MKCHASTKPKTVSRYNEKSPAMIRSDCLRRNVVMLINQCEQERLAETLKREKQFEQDIRRLQDMCRSQFEKWQERSHRASIMVIENIKPSYDRTYALRKAIAELEKKRIKLNARIVSLTNHWIRRTIIQNFHYQLFVTDSKDERSVVVPNLNCNDSTTIKAYYDNEFRENRTAPVIVYPDRESFETAIVQLHSIVYVSLKKLHYTLLTLAKAQHENNKLKGNLKKYMKYTNVLISHGEDDLEFMKDRVKKLKSDAIALVEGKVRDCVALPLYRTIVSLSDIIFVETLPEQIRHDVKKDCGPFEKLQIVFQFVISIIDKLDRIPTTKRKAVEAAYRKSMAYKIKMSQKAWFVEKQIELNVKQIKRSLK